MRMCLHILSDVALCSWCVYVAFSVLHVFDCIFSQLWLELFALSPLSLRTMVRFLAAASAAAHKMLVFQTRNRLAAGKMVDPWGSDPEGLPGLKRQSPGKLNPCRGGIVRQGRNNKRYPP